ncbi:MAG: Fur family transcriptional regulator [bacterium]|nr:Fur family transcriptional regulator [bacterium]
MKQATRTLLRQYNLRITQSRSLVLQAMLSTKTPLTHKEIHRKILKTDGSISLVTVYRILEAYENIGLVHRHLSTGSFILCSLQGEKGHHVMLSCQDCGTVAECIDKDFCKHEDRIAKSAGFSPKAHLSELIGICSSCS